MLDYFPAPLSHWEDSPTERYEKHIKITLQTYNPEGDGWVGNFLLEVFSAIVDPSVNE